MWFTAIYSSEKLDHCYFSLKKLVTTIWRPQILGNSYFEPVNIGLQLFRAPKKLDHYYL